MEKSLAQHTLDVALHREVLTELILDVASDNKDIANPYMDMVDVSA